MSDIVKVSHIPEGSTGAAVGFVVGYVGDILLFYGIEQFPQLKSMAMPLGWAMKDWAILAIVVLMVLAKKYTFAAGFMLGSLVSRGQFK